MNGGRPRNNAGWPRALNCSFRYRDPRTGKGVRARYAEWEILGPAEIRDVEPEARYFTPHRSPLDAALRRYNERPPELQPAVDAGETFLLRLFLRRYITYCAGRRRYAAMNGAGQLYASLRDYRVERRAGTEYGPEAYFKLAKA